MTKQLDLTQLLLNPEVLATIKQQYPDLAVDELLVETVDAKTATAQILGLKDKNALLLAQVGIVYLLTGNDKLEGFDDVEGVQQLLDDEVVQWFEQHPTYKFLAALDEKDLILLMRKIASHDLFKTKRSKKTSDNTTIDCPL